MGRRVGPRGQAAPGADTGRLGRRYSGQ